MMKPAAATVVLSVVLSLAAPVEAQSPAERDAYAGLERAVRAAQSAPGPDSAARRLADVRRAIEHAYSVFQDQERHRDAAEEAFRHAGNNWDPHDDQHVARVAAQYAELLGRPTAAYRAFSILMSRVWQAWNTGGGWRWRTDRTNHQDELMTCDVDFSLCREFRQTWNTFRESHGRDAGAHWRYLHAAADAMVEAANALEALSARFTGFDVRHDAMLQRLGSAKLASIRSQERVLQAASACEAGDCSRSPDAPADFDRSLQELVDAAVAVAEGLALEPSCAQRLIAPDAPRPLPGRAHGRAPEAGPVVHRRDARRRRAAPFSRTTRGVRTCSRCRRSRLPVSRFASDFPRRAGRPHPLHVRRPHRWNRRPEHGRAR